MTGGDGGGAGAYVIDGRFELIERLGGGGMGLVWRARDLMLQREVALKEVRSPDPAVYGSDPSEAHVVRERVLREAQALARLHHPNVVTIYHIVDAPRLAHPWLVMELVSGGSLEGRLKRGTLSVPEAARIGRGVLAALRAAHAAGIQHRDVKPGNVLLRADGTPVLTDFGIAALEATPGLTATGMLIGSPEYMAPERIHGREGDPASDLWSLGIMLYLGLEGHNPLRRDTTIATIAAVAEANVPPPQRSGAMGPALSALLVKDPARRPTAEQLDWMLAEVEAGRAGAGPYPGPQPAPYPGPQPVDSGGGTGWSPTARYEMPGQATGEYGAPGQSTGEYGGYDRSTGGYGRPDSPTGQNPASDTNPVANPYGTGTTANPIKRPNFAVRYVVSTVMTLGIAGTAMYFSGTFGNGPNANHNTSSRGTDEVGPGAVPISSPAQSQPGGDTSTGGGPTAAAGHSSTAPKTGGLTPAFARSSIAAVIKAAGSTKFVKVTVYDDGSAIFDIVKKDDPRAYDSWRFDDGQASFWTKGSSIDPDQKVFDPTKVNWDALPALIKDGRANLNVKDPKMIYAIVETGFNPEDTADGLELDLHVTNDYYGGYTRADTTGKILKRFPQE